ncbi:MAG: NAD(P)H-dependent glycerol-3-phosphate dehydrogenase [Pseudomonadota bacterium]
MTIAVLGAGAFGTALAIALAENGPVRLWARDAAQCGRMDRDRENSQRLPGCRFPENLRVCEDLETAFEADILLLTMPMQALSGFAAAHNLSGQTVIVCCKGMDLETGQGPSALLCDAGTVAVLTGPSFATDIARGLPTALTLACADVDAAADLQQKLSTPVLRLYRTNDVPGAEIGGALKNVIAIGCGAVAGAGLGNSARAALMTRGFAEILRVGLSMGAQPETMMGLSGFGDLVLTCTSELSRNYRLGQALGRGESFDPTLTVEGVATAHALMAATKLDLPICAAVADLVAERINVSQAMSRLMARPLGEE